MAFAALCDPATLLLVLHHLRAEGYMRTMFSSNSRAPSSGSRICTSQTLLRPCRCDTARRAGRPPSPLPGAPHLPFRSARPYPGVFEVKHRREPEHTKVLNRYLCDAPVRRPRAAVFLCSSELLPTALIARVGSSSSLCLAAPSPWKKLAQTLAASRFRPHPVRLDMHSSRTHRSQGTV